MKTCKICGATEIDVVAQLMPKQGGDCEALRCRQCGFLWADPLPAFTPELLSQIYGEAYTEEIRALENNAASQAILYDATIRQLDVLGDMFPSSLTSKKALNIGAMTISSKVLVDQGWDVTAIEVSEYAAKTAELKWGLRVIQGKIEDVPLPDDTFDLVKLSHVIEHLADPMPVLRKLRATMRFGAVLLLETDNSAGLKTWFEITVRRIIGDNNAARLVYQLTKKDLRKRYGRLIPFEHVCLFNKKNLFMAVENAGLKPVELLCPAQGDPVWFPFTNQMQRWTPLERFMTHADALGAKIGRGEVLVLFARKE